MTIKLLPIVKGLVSFVTSAGIGAIVENAIKSTTPVNISTYSKVLTIIGRVALTGYLSDKTSDYVEAKIDEVVKKKEKPLKNDFEI